MKEKTDKKKTVLIAGLVITLAILYIVVMLIFGPIDGWYIVPRDASSVDMLAYAGFIYTFLRIAMKKIFGTDKLTDRKRTFLIASMVIFLIAAISSIYCFITERNVHVIFRLITLILFSAVAMTFPYGPSIDLDDDQ